LLALRYYFALDTAGDLYAYVCHANDPLRRMRSSTWFASRAFLKLRHHRPCRSQMRPWRT